MLAYYERFLLDQVNCFQACASIKPYAFTLSLCRTSSSPNPLPQNALALSQAHTLLLPYSPITVPIPGPLLKNQCQEGRRQVHQRVVAPRAADWRVVATRKPVNSPEAHAPISWPLRHRHQPLSSIFGFSLSILHGVMQAKEKLPTTVSWQPQDLLTVMLFSMAGSGLFFAANNLLLQQNTPGSDPISLVKAVAAAVAAQGAGSPPATEIAAAAAELLKSFPESVSLHDLLMQYAHLHLAQEALLSTLLPGAVILALRPPATEHNQSRQVEPPKPTASQLSQHGQDEAAQSAATAEENRLEAHPNHQQQLELVPPTDVSKQQVGGMQQQQQQQQLGTQLPPAQLAIREWTSPVRSRWDGGSWVGQTLVICAVAFPLADPLLHIIWEPVTTVSTCIGLQRWRHP